MFLVKVILRLPLQRFSSIVSVMLKLSISFFIKMCPKSSLACFASTYYILCCCHPIHNSFICYVSSVRDVQVSSVEQHINSFQSLGHHSQQRPAFTRVE